MLHDPDNPDLSWEDCQKDVEYNPDRPFYAEGNDERNRDAYADRRCRNIGRMATKYNDCTGGYYYTCEEKE